VEPLEDRNLMSVLPAPDVTSQLNISTTQTAQANSPQIAIDPANPQFMVSVWSTGATIQGAYSSNAGLTWQPFGGLYVPLADAIVPTTIYAQATNPTVAFDRTAAIDPATGQVIANLESFYVTYVEHRTDNQAGVVLLEKWDFHTGFPVQQPLYNSQEGPSGSFISLYQWAAQDPAHADPALNPVVVADANLPPVLTDPKTGNKVSFIDPRTGATQVDNLIVPLQDNNPGSVTFGQQVTFTDPTTGKTGTVYQGAVYVAWNTNNATPTLGGSLSPFGPVGAFNPSTIRLEVSSDGGETFSTPRFLNDVNDTAVGGPFVSLLNDQRFTAPTLTVPQGTTSDRPTGLVNGQNVTAVQGGQLTGVFDNFAPNRNQIQSNTVQDGGAAGLFTDSNVASVQSNDPFARASHLGLVGGTDEQNYIYDGEPRPGGGPDIQGVTQFQIPVNIEDPNFTTVSDLQVGVNLVHPTDNEVELDLISQAKLATPYNVVINPADGNLYVSSFANNSVVEYDGARANPNSPTAGNLIRVFVPPANNGGLAQPDGLGFGPDGNLYVSSTTNGEVIEYNGSTGAFVKVFLTVTSGGAPAQTSGLLFDGNGNLFVGDVTDNEVIEFAGPNSATPGAVIKVFQGGGLQGPEGMAIGNDGGLYVASPNNNEIIRYDLATGVGAVFSAVPQLNSPFGIAFGTDNDLYVTNTGNNTVIRLHGPIQDGATIGGFLGNFVSGGFGGGLQQPRGIAFMIDSTGVINPLDNPLFVVSSGTAEIDRYTGAVGVPAPAVVGNGAVLVGPAGGLTNPQSILFRPRLGGETPGNFLVANGNEVLRFSNTGVLVSNFVPAGANGLVAANGLAIDALGNTYVANGNGSILKYSGVAAGAFQGNFVSPAPPKQGILGVPGGIIFDFNGNLIVADQSQNQILRYTATGAPDPLFPPPPNNPSSALFIADPRLNRPVGLAVVNVGGTPVLLVANAGNGPNANTILAFDLNTGNPFGPNNGVFAVGSATVPLVHPEYIFANGADNSLYVPSDTDRVLRFSTAFGSFGTYLESVVPLANNPANDGGLLNPSAVAVDNGRIYVVSAGNNEVMRYNGQPAGFLPSQNNPNAIFEFAGGGAAKVFLDPFHIDPSGNAVNQPFSGGANFGLNASIPYDTVFDQFAPRFINDPGAASPYAEHFRPQFSPLGTDGFNSLLFIAGHGLQDVNGIWTLQIIDTRESDGGPNEPNQHLNSWYLNFTSKLDTVGRNANVGGGASPGNASEDGSSIVVGGATISAEPNAPVKDSPSHGTGPTPVIAVDNTLGSFSPYQGRLYVAYTTGSGDATDIFLSTSDDGGQTWLRTPVKVNDDSPADNFSDGTRPQFDPSVAVDQTTGTLVLSFLDARNDADRARTALYLATSLNGGWLVDPATGNVVPDFAPETYLNDSSEATDAITEQQGIVLEPKSDNPNGNATFNFGDRQGLAVSHGLVYPAWASNHNQNSMVVSGVEHVLPSGALAGGATIAAGPRIVSSTMGPVTTGTVLTDDGRTFLFNNTFAADGTQQVNGFVVTFDRPVDPTTFSTGQVQVFYRDTTTPAGTPPTPVPVTEVIPLDGYTTRYGPGQVGGIDVTDPQVLDPNTGAPFDIPLLATKFLVTFQPRSGTGTYSYAVGPNVADRVRSIQPSIGATINPPHTQTNSTSLRVPPQDSGGDAPPNIIFDPRDTTTSTITFAGVPSTEEIKDVTVNLTIHHTFDSDLLIVLQAPDGTQVTLVNREGGSGQNFINTTFNDTAATPISAGPPNAVAPFTGTFKPETPLAAFVGKQVNGTWTLLIDDTAQGNIGVLDNWTLTLSTGPAVVNEQTGNQMDENGNAINAEPANATTGADVYSTPTPVDQGPLFHPVYDSTTLPLIVPGPHIVSTFVQGRDDNGNLLNPPTADNLVLNQAVHAIDVTFDRDMDPNAFTTGLGPTPTTAGTSALLSLIGPTGNIPLFDPTTGQPVHGVTIVPDPYANGGLGQFGPAGYPRLINGVISTAHDPDVQHPRTFMITLPDQPGTPLGNGLDQSGSYSLSLAPTMRAENKGGQAPGQGDLLDTNQNAGLDLLRGTASDATSASFVIASHNYGGPAVTVPGGKSLDIPLTFGPEDFLIQKATVQVNIQSPFDPSLEAQLIAPDGTIVKLFTNVGNNGTRSNFSNTLFDDTARTPIQQGVAPFNSVQFGPFNPQTPLNVLNGKPSTGVWTLRLINDGVASPAATLTDWSLNLTEAVPGTGLGETHADQATVNFRIFTGDAANPLSHTTWTAVGPASSTTAVTPATTDSTNSTSVTHTFTGQVPLAPNHTQDITLNFAPENFPIQKAVVTLNIQTPNVSDLKATLVSPTGTRVLLFANVPTNGADFANTVFDDLGRASIAIGVSPAVAPFYSPIQGAFIPQVPLSTLLNQSSAGVWHLLVENDSATDTGTLTSWSLTLSQPTPSNSGRVTTLAVDPSDPSGNTVYAGGASGGIWKTTNFLTPDKMGPTWVPLTDFGPLGAINISSIAVFPRNNDPRQSIVFATTGDGDTQTGGVGILRSMDGGNTWTLLDSTNNVNSPIVGQGVLTPINDAGRDHAFVGLTSYKVVVDPTHAPTGPDDVIVYAAMGGTNAAGQAIGGLWRSLDSGRHWQLMSAATGQQAVTTNCTDVVLAPATVSVSTGNLQNVYAAFRSVNGAPGGVYLSTNQGASLRLLAGGQGDTLIRDGDVSPAGTVNVANGPTPNGNVGRIVLAVPPLANNHINPTTHLPDLVLNAQDPQNLIYQGWVYAAVVNPNGTFNGLYLTKDTGANWTQVNLPHVQTPLGLGTPTNDETNPNHDTEGGIDQTSGFSNNTAQTSVPGGNGNYALSLAVDPNNPSVVYLGGLDNVGILQTPAPAGGLIRVDVTKLTDPHRFTAFDNNDNAGAPAPFEAQTVGGLNLKAPGGAFKVLLQNPDGSGNVKVITPLSSTPYLNLITDPNNPFLANATILVTGVNGFTNSGEESFYNPDIQMVGGPTGFEENGDLGVHSILGLVDPLTGKTRLLLGADTGVFSVIDQGNGQLLRSIGDTTDLSSQSGDTSLVSGSRNGNLQIAQMLGGTSQPSVIAAEVASAIRGSGGLFYGNTMNNGFPVSDPNVLDNGNIFWSGPLGTGTGITTDQTGSGTAYSFQWPGFGIFSQLATTNFFVVNPNGAGYSSRTGTGGTSLVLGPTTGNNLNPDVEWPFQAQFVPTGPNSPDAIVPNSRPAVNPIEGDQLVVSSSTGRVFRSRDQGRTWSIIADPATLGNGGYAPALAYGAPDPNDPFHQLDDFIWVGTQSGTVWVTLDGGTDWTNVSAGLDGSPIMSIQTDPTRGSFDAYAVTEKGVFHIDLTSVSYPFNGAPVINGGTAVSWTSVTGNLFNIQAAFNPSSFNGLVPLLPTDPNQPLTAPELTRTNFLTSLAVDWRDVTGTNKAAFPPLYVGGNSGVYRSVDGGTTWTIFPSVAQDGARVDGGYLPMVQVTDLTLATGGLNPATSQPNQATGPNVLLATTYGRGEFAIRLNNFDSFNPVEGPQVTAMNGTALSNGTVNVNVPTGTTSVTVTFANTVDPNTFKNIDEVAIFDPNGAKVPVISITDVPPAGAVDQHTTYQITFAAANTAGTYSLVFGPGLNSLLGPRDFAGNQMDQNNNGSNGEPGQSPVGDQFVGHFTVAGGVTTGLSVASAIPDSTTSPPGVSSVTLTFSGTTAGVDLPSQASAVTVSGPGGPITGLTFTDVSAAAGLPAKTVWRINLPGAPLLATGNYTVGVSSTLQDLSGQTLQPASGFSTVFTVTSPSQGGGGGGGGGVVTPTVLPPGVVSPDLVAFMTSKKKLKNGRVRFVVQAINVSGSAIPAPLALVVLAPKGYRLLNASGVSSSVVPGLPYQLAFPGTSVVNPFEGATFVLDFKVKKSAKKKAQPGFLLVGGLIRL
jgi:subtilisin-like proprotein convertase family protein